MALDAAGNAFLMGETSPRGWVSGGYDTTLGGSSDDFVVKISGAAAIRGDLNDDGEIDGLDVDSFVAAVVGNGAAAAGDVSAPSIATHAENVARGSDTVAPSVTALRRGDNADTRRNDFHRPRQAGHIMHGARLVLRHRLVDQVFQANQRWNDES